MTNYRLPGTITEPPAAFKQWLSDNHERLARTAARGTTPYFVKDNLSYIGDTPVPTSPITTQTGSGGNNGFRLQHLQRLHRMTPTMNSQKR